MKFCRYLMLLMVLMSAVCSATPVAIYGVLQRADGSFFSGYVTIQWQAFTNAQGQLIPAGNLSQYPIVNGVVSVSLEPNISASPQGTSYNVIYNLNGSPTYSRRWYVPTTNSPPVPLVNVEFPAQGLVGVTAIVSPTQLITTGAVAGQCLEFNGAYPVWGSCFGSGLHVDISTSDDPFPYRSPINPANYAYNYIRITPTSPGTAGLGYSSLESIITPSPTATKGNYVGLTFGVSNKFGGTGSSDMGMWAFNTYTEVNPNFQGVVVGGEMDIGVFGENPGLYKRSAGLGLQLTSQVDFGNGFAVGANNGSGGTTGCEGSTWACGSWLNGYVAANSYTGMTINMYSDQDPQAIQSISNTTPPIVTLVNTMHNCYQGEQQDVNISITGSTFYDGVWGITPITPCKSFSLVGGTASGVGTSGTAYRVASGGIVINLPTTNVGANGGSGHGALHFSIGEDSHPVANLIEVQSAAGPFNFVLTEGGQISAAAPNPIFGGCVLGQGTGDPNGSRFGSPCDLYVNKAGGSGATLWVKESGSVTVTGWVAK